MRETRRAMRTELDHLPIARQRGPARVVEILFEEFNEARACTTPKRKKSARPLKIILPDFHARGEWVNGPHTAKGYRSDHDLPIIVNHSDLKDVATYWYAAEDRFSYDPRIKTPLNVIVHTLEEVNDALAKGQYFFSDIKREGIALYEMKGSKPLAEPKALTPDEAHAVAKGHYERWMPSAGEFFDGFRYTREQRRLNEAAFHLHQTVERLYTCFLLVRTNYSPATHNIKFLRSLAERLDERLIDAWPRETKHDRRCFELLKRAYVEARYSEHYRIKATELEWLGRRIARLSSIVKEICESHLREIGTRSCGQI